MEIELNKIYNQDCIDFLKSLPDNSIDSIVTDPPAGISFMAKKWDDDKGGKKQWIAWMESVMTECLRVLKPGGHALVWTIPRTSHWTTNAIEDAGFEIRDKVYHIFGTGFPKSRNINLDLINIITEGTFWIEVLKVANIVATQSSKKQIEIGININLKNIVHDYVHQNQKEILLNVNAVIAELQLCGVYHKIEENIHIAPVNVEPNTTRLPKTASFAGQLKQNLNLNVLEDFFAAESVVTFLEEKIMEMIREEEVRKTWNGRTLYSKLEIIDAVCAEAMNALKHIMLNQSKTFRNLDTMLQTECVSATTVIITKSIMDNLTLNMANILKNQTDGLGTALKPATEEWILARKPLEKGLTVAENIMKWGTGGINVDGCRVSTDDVLTRDCLGWTSAKHEGYQRPSYENAEKRMFGSIDGRFPANLILDDSPEVKEEFGKYGIHKSGAMKKHYEYVNNGNSLGKPTGKTKSIHDSNEGSIARFFYCAKASVDDREEGLEGFEGKMLDTGREEGSIGGSNPRNRGAQTKRANHHPTVKNTSLMMYLCRLITPVNGTVLDPFSGSGSTGKAAILEGFNFIGCELDPEYVKIANARIEYAIKNKDILIKKYSSVVDKIIPKAVSIKQNNNDFF